MRGMGGHARPRRSRAWPFEAGDAGRDDPACDRELVDWRRLGRRLWLFALAWAGFAVLGTGSTTVLGGVLVAASAFWAGVAALGFLASVLAAVALSAFGGMLRAGERRQRLAGGDVGLMPPQVRRRQGRDGGR